MAASLTARTEFWTTLSLQPAERAARLTTWRIFLRYTGSEGNSMEARRHSDVFMVSLNDQQCNIVLTVWKGGNFSCNGLNSLPCRQLSPSVDQSLDIVQTNQVASFRSEERR